MPERNNIDIPIHERCDLEVLMSCMHQDDFSIARCSKVNSDLLIINQCDCNRYDEIIENGHLWRMISTTERGLSKSRNMALRNARGAICVFSDDDEVFVENYKAILCEAFKKIPHATAIAFNVIRINNYLKKKYYVITQIRESFRERAFGSPMISIRLEDLLKNDICFDERFGSGSNWGGGEDSLLQREIRKHGLKIYEIPETLTTIDYGQNSNWFFGFDEKYFYNLGAFSQFCDNNLLKRYAYYFYLVFIKLRHDNKLSPFLKIKWLLLGERGWKKQIPFKNYICDHQRKINPA